MPELIPPTTRVHASFLKAMAEFAAEGRGPGDGSMIGHDLAAYGHEWGTPEGFDRYVRRQRADMLEETPRPSHHVPATTLWWVEGDEYLGRISIRHRLTESLREVGGHIGYDVRASARRRGHATAMLRAALPIARDLGIDPALLTCESSNVASRLVIEHNGGVFSDERNGKRRYWVPTSPLLDAYSPRTPLEEADVGRARATAGWSRDRPLHVTGSAFIVHPPSGRVLLRWHTRQQAWLQVGGHADPGEASLLAVAIREGEEETGLTDLYPWPTSDVLHVVIVPVPAAPHEAAHEHADVRYVLATSTPDAVRPEKPDAPLRWLTVAAALDLVGEENVRESLRRLPL